MTKSPRVFSSVQLRFMEAVKYGGRQFYTVFCYYNCFWAKIWEKQFILTYTEENDRLTVKQFNCYEQIFCRFPVRYAFVYVFFFACESHGHWVVSVQWIEDQGVESTNLKPNLCSFNSTYNRICISSRATNNISNHFFKKKPELSSGSPYIQRIRTDVLINLFRILLVGFAFLLFCLFVFFYFLPCIFLEELISWSAR